jgi:hypothetical protein
MPPPIPLAELERLRALIAQHPQGVALPVLQATLGAAMQARTLQRRLAALVQQGQVLRLGQGRAVRYRLASPSELLAPNPVLPTDGAELPLSTAATEVRATVRQPLHLRRPVGYQTAFLADYHPNQTHYLSTDLRRQLHSMGCPAASQAAAAGTLARDLLSRLLIDLSWASSQLEGNTYSRLDTARLIEHGQLAEGKDLLEAQMILNHKQAIEYLVLDPAGGELSVSTVIALHALLADGLMPDPAAVGRLRQRPVEISGSVYRPLAVPQRLEELFGIVVQMAAEIIDPFEQAFFLMVHLPYLQPFEDVNKRVSRLVANMPLIRHNLSPLSFLDVPQAAYVDAMLGVYELNRVELLRDVFVWAYERSCQQYVAIRQQLVPPDILRLRYRKALSAVIAAVVRQGAAATEAEVAARVPDDVAQADRARFVALVLHEFQSLNPDNVVRFGLRPLEFVGWVELGQKLGR